VSRVSRGRQPEATACSPSLQLRERARERGVKHPQSGFRHVPWVIRPSPIHVRCAAQAVWPDRCGLPTCDERSRHSAERDG
jgi:hypothetical protein